MKTTITIIKQNDIPTDTLYESLRAMAEFRPREEDQPWSFMVSREALESRLEDVTSDAKEFPEDTDLPIERDNLKAFIDSMETFLVMVDHDSFTDKTTG